MLAFRVARGAYALGRRSHAGQHPFARRQAPYSTAKLHAAKSGDFVAVHYTGTLDDGTVFDSSRQRDPLTFVVGAGKVVQGFDTAVTGLDVGGTRQRDPSLTMTFPASSAPKGLEQGMQVQLSNGMVATVVKMSPEELVLDMNHELTGKHLTFDVELMNLVAAESMRKATFGAGCFWGVELAFQRVPGVLATEVGYCNGFVDDPTYEAVCSGNTGHAEVVQLVYDPSQVSYETLLDVFWDKHDPTTLNRQGGDSGTQYRSGIYCHTEEQKEVAAKSMAKAQARFKAPITTEIADISKYSAAEAYHQAYLARGGRFGQPQNPSKGCTDPIRCYG